jgi:hypothetical protein
MYSWWYFFAHCRVTIEAGRMSVWKAWFSDSHLTFEELLACVFFEKCFVRDRAVEVVDH